MTDEPVTSATLRQLVQIGLPWLLAQRDLHTVRGSRLTDTEKRLLEPYHSDATLDRIRIANVDQIFNPPFYSELRACGWPALDISGAVGIAFVDCVVICNSVSRGSASWYSVLFHELVHVLQFEIMGPEKHLETYLRGWLENGCQYQRIPLEVQAHRMEARFNRHEPPFLVRQVVEEELGLML